MPEVRNGKIKRRRPAVVQGVEYDVFGLLGGSPSATHSKDMDVFAALVKMVQTVF
jgi:hypothetical protein